MDLRTPLAILVLACVTGTAGAGDPRPRDADVERGRMYVLARDATSLERLARRKTFRGDTYDFPWRTVARHFDSVDPLSPDVWAGLAKTFDLDAEALRLIEGLLESAVPASRDQIWARAAAAAAVAGRYEDAARWIRIHEATDVGPATAARVYAASSRTPTDSLRFVEDFWQVPLHTGHALDVWCERAVTMFLLSGIEGAPGAPERAYETAYRHGLRSFERDTARRALAAWLAGPYGAAAPARAAELHAELAKKYLFGQSAADAVLVTLRPTAALTAERAVLAAEHLAATGLPEAAAPVFRNVLATSQGGLLPDKGARDRARVGLAELLEAGGKPAEARSLYEALEAANAVKCNFGFCGIPREVSFRVARCLVAEGAMDVAIRDHLLAEYRGTGQPMPPPFGGPHEGNVDLHVAIEAGRGRLDELARTLAAVEQPFTPSIDLARHLIAMHRAAAARDAEGVARAALACRPQQGALESFPMSADSLLPQVVRALTLLAGLPEAPTALAKVFDSLPVVRLPGGPGPSGRGIVVGFVRSHPSPGARKVLEAWVRRLDAGEDLGIDRRILSEALEFRTLSDLP